MAGGKLRPLRGHALVEGINLGGEAAGEGKAGERVEVGHHHQSVSQLRHRPTVTTSQEILERKKQWETG